MVEFDHIIHYVKELSTVETEGILPIHSGGKHERLGTKNLLSYFDQRYVEYLGIDDEAVFKQHLEESKDSFATTIDSMGYEEGFIRYALSTDEIHQLADRYRAQGFTPVGPVDMERRTGTETIRWKLLYIEDESEIFPFFIQWEESKAQRLDRISQLRGNLLSPKMNIHHAVRSKKAWEAFFDVIGVWEGEIDPHTTITLSENKNPSITLEVEMDGEPVIYKGAVYKFI
ncbi:VOC family protein [Salinicoccus hispanicus]|uniref:VOC family protein n=1 Tax=Salinicoccus hispanicus TaxID=157225 RepID=A0A6N8U381_9STAP|nr:VOC family protein [Salinicoccus hispanicus]MXQ51757.1 VOC family protein [Salinicoccus hispanicus]